MSMQLSQATAELWIPDGASEAEALRRVTHLAIAAHQDDVELMALEGILAGFGNGKRSFMAVIVTDGAGSPRTGRYANHSNEEMQIVRRMEQKKAAFVGEYSAVALLNHPSADVKCAKNLELKQDLKSIVAAAQPEVLYTHNLADKHDTHVAVALRTIAAVRELPVENRPKKLYGCEVWRDLDWLIDNDKVVFRAGAHDNIAASIIGVFDSQISGGKRYDLAAAGRRRANATFLQSHQVDTTELIDFGMDLTPLIQNDQLDPNEYVGRFVQRFAADVSARISKLR
jgi:LmbE family N-acetylglucosaminyl deacetylase